ncbi:hypothetical protein LTR66_000139 [Elasticomyces elasticus]|nr:hypothetical protein LTR50_005287 [Elasticomyces elasticus]KAK5001101.1 hypothetical protein LTR66_000139 [Elasticomyces elasticus]KAK5010836.1 hypothetical protein LTR28_007431 [Elasticomyces elasticus]
MASSKAKIIEIEKAFSGRPQLWDRIDSYMASHPDTTSLFHDIADYIHSLSHASETSVKDIALRGQPQTKKRKLAPGSVVGDNGWQNGDAFYSAAEISFSIPQRKKLTLQLVPAWKDRSGRTFEGGLRITDPKAVDAERQGMSWAEMDQVFCLPVPEKPQRQHNFIVISKSTSTSPVPQQVVWTVYETPPKTVVFGEGYEAAEDETYFTSTLRCMDAQLMRFGKKVILPDEKEFASATEQSHRKGEKAFHVKAHIGSKDGFLFFLSTGIIFAFRKPILYFPSSVIESISYTSVLQRTFNLVIRTCQSPDFHIASLVLGVDKFDTEFSMLNQPDFAGIDGYIKRHQLNDASMAKERRAKKLNLDRPKGQANGATDGAPNVNGSGAADEDEDEEEDEEEGELQKAERQLQDAEDEREEDYDPGSEGESEGEGGSEEDDSRGSADEEIDHEDEIGGERDGEEEE